MRIVWSCNLLGRGFNINLNGKGQRLETLTNLGSRTKTPELCVVITNRRAWNRYMRLISQKKIVYDHASLNKPNPI